MTDEKELCNDTLLHYHNAHSKKARSHDQTLFLAQTREVVHIHRFTRQRFLPFLPYKHTETKEYLQIPEHITTEDQLRDYVAEKKPFWLDRHNRRRSHS